MDKSKMKSILPKPSAMQTPPPGGKRKSVTQDYYPKRLRFTASPSPPLSAGSASGLKQQQLSAQSQAAKQSRPVTSCTFCRQHKIKCNASESYPNPCTRCTKMDLKCEIDPQFKPKKGLQIQMLIGDVEELKAKIEMLLKNEHLLTQALNQHNMNYMQQPARALTPQHQRLFSAANTPNLAINQITGHNTMTPPGHMPAMTPPGVNGGPAMHLASAAQVAGPAHFTPMSGVINDATAPSGPGLAITNLSQVLHADSTDNSPATLSESRPDALPESPTYVEFVLGDVRLPLAKADELHERFMAKFVPFLPILTLHSATQLYTKSKLLFWTVMLTASLSEPEPALYMSLASLIKQLAIETCWIRTPRSTHVIQALIILSVWPLPNEKVLDDCLYRFVGVAKNLLLQLGLHRGGEFIQEFSRTQANLGPDSDLWRTRTWLAVFFCDQFWSSALGLPPSINTTDYLLENARIDQLLPSNFRCLISLAIFQCKLVNVMGISVTRPDGLLEPLNRAASLNILDRELERLKFKLNIMDGLSIEIYYLYLRLMICCFAFLPGTPIEDQVKYVSTAYLASTRIITISSQLLSLNSISLAELPIYVRQAITYAALLLFKLHLSRYLIEKYVDSARQSIVTVHRLFRNTLSSWKDLQNDMSRTAKVLENLNIVLYTYPEIFSEDPANLDGSIITRMRSHLTASLFYDLVWCIHEAKRRTMQIKANGQDSGDTIRMKNDTGDELQGKRPQPLPFYNQITKDDFKTITTTTPNGTTVTTLVPTDQALTQAKLASANGTRRPLEINGIPLSMLEATGSTKDRDVIKYPHLDSPAPGGEGAELSLGPALSFALDQLLTQPKQELISPLNATPMLYDSHMSPDVEGRLPINGSYPYNGAVAGPDMADQLDTFFQQQSHGWLNNTHQDDDFLGWIDVNMLREK